MTSREPPEEKESAATLQRLAIAAGTFLIVTLTVIAAIFLAMQDLPEPPATPEARVTPSPSLPGFTPTPLMTPTPRLLPTFTATAVPISPVAPTGAPAPLPPPTETPIPIVVTVTPSPPAVVIVVTPTPEPIVPTTPAPVEGGVCQPPASWVVYTVQVGDTLRSLAERTDSSISELQRVNCLESFTLQAGQTVYLPFVPPTPTVTSTPSPTRRPGPTPTRTPTPITPQIDSVAPPRVDRTAADSGLVLTVLGRNFQPEASGFRVELRGPATVRLNLANRGSSTSFDVNVPPGLPEGTYALVVTNPNERAGIRQSAFTIGPPVPTDTPAPPPEIIQFTPLSGKITEDVTLTVQGTNFKSDQPGFKVELQSISSNFRASLELGDVRTDTNFTAVIRANTIPVGDYDLIVANPDGRSDIADDRYRAMN